MQSHLAVEDQHQIVAQTDLVVIQPSSFCNIDCRYCYVPNRENRAIIAPEVLEDILRKVFTSDHVADGFRLLWHNGEPLSLGISFYENVISTIKKVNVNDKPFRHCIQTNATLISQSWVDFFREHQISASVSIDGPKEIHDANRVTRSGRGTFDDTIAGIRLLRENDIKLVGLCVVTAGVLDHGKELIQFFVDQGFESLGLIVEEPWGGNPESSFTLDCLNNSEETLEKRYQQFLKDAFQAWYPHRSKLEIREFDDMFSAFERLKSSPATVTKQEDAVGCKVLSFNRFGGVTTFSPQMIAGTVADPDRFVVCNIGDIKSLNEIGLLPKHSLLQEQINSGINKCKESCGYFTLCGGGSPASKFYEHGSFEVTQTRECRFAKQLMSKVLLEELATIPFTPDDDRSRQVSAAMSQFSRSHSRVIDGKTYIWNVERLWELSRSLVPFELNLEEVSELDRDCWFCDIRPPTIRNTARHTKRIIDADLNYPIILNSDGSLMDGAHRVAKALILGRERIAAVRFDVTPLPDAVE